MWQLRYDQPRSPACARGRRGAIESPRRVTSGDAACAAAAADGEPEGHGVCAPAPTVLPPGDAAGPPRADGRARTDPPPRTVPARMSWPGAGPGQIVEILDATHVVFRGRAPLGGRTTPRRCRPP